MLRITRPLFQQLPKLTTGITGLKVHPNPLPVLKDTYESTLKALSALPATSVYRQSAEAITQHKLSIVEKVGSNVSQVEKELGEGQIEEALDVAEDELKLAGKMLQWKALV